MRGSKPVLVAKASPTSAGSSAAGIGWAVPSIRTRSRVGPMPTRTLPVAWRLRLVGMLARKGYTQGMSYRVVREELRSAGDDTTVLDDIPLD